MWYPLPTWNLENNNNVCFAPLVYAFVWAIIWLPQDVSSHDNECGWCWMAGRDAQWRAHIHNSQSFLPKEPTYILHVCIQLQRISPPKQRMNSLKCTLGVTMMTHHCHSRQRTNEQNKKKKQSAYSRFPPTPTDKKNGKHRGSLTRSIWLELLRINCSSIPILVLRLSTPRMAHGHTDERDLTCTTHRPTGGMMNQNCRR